MGVNMKSSTLRRSNITREKIAMLSALSDYNASKGRSNRNLTDKQAELDLLWQNFKVSTSTNNSPKSFFIFGVITGAIIAVIAMTFFNFIFSSSNLSDINIKPTHKSTENVKFTFIPADKTAGQEADTIPQEKEYIVQSGDSLEDISMRFYGCYDNAKLKAIQERNNLKDLNSINIGQKLIIPISENNQ